MAKYSTLTALFTAIANSLRGKTGSTGSIVADDFPSVIDSLSTGGITPTGTKTITTNGTHDVTAYASASVNVPTGITPTGTKTITTNGTHDVTNYANAQVNVPTGITPSGSLNITTNGTHNVTNYENAVVNIPGLNAKIFAVSIASDATSGIVTLLAANDYIKSLKTKEDAFILVRYLDVAASTAMQDFWFMTNKPICYQGTTAYKTISIRSSASAASFQGNKYGLDSGENYNGHLCVDANGKIYLYAISAFPLKAGNYQIIAGTFEML